MRNLELKAACDGATFAAVSCRAGSLGTRQSLWHRDTYFAVPHGRLKLREIREDGAASLAELIGYERPDLEGSRWSSYHRATILPDDLEALRAALTTTIGERIVVEKRRELVIARHTRIHLDTVERLGHFIELETVISDDLCEDDAAREHEEIIVALGIGNLPPIGGSYSDLLEAAATK